MKPGSNRKRLADPSMLSLSYYARRVRELGLRESMRQAKTIVFDAAAARINGLYDRYFTPTAEEESNQLFKRLLRQPGFLNEVKTRRKPLFFLDREPEFYRDAIRKYFPGEESRIVGAADNVRNRNF